MLASVATAADAALIATWWGTEAKSTSGQAVVKRRLSSCQANTNVVAMLKLKVNKARNHLSEYTTMKVPSLTPLWNPEPIFKRSRLDSSWPLPFIRDQHCSGCMSPGHDGRRRVDPVLHPTDHYRTSRHRFRSRTTTTRFFSLRLRVGV